MGDLRKTERATPKQTVASEKKKTCLIQSRLLVNIKRSKATKPRLPNLAVEKGGRGLTCTMMATRGLPDRLLWQRLYTRSLEEAALAGAALAGAALAGAPLSVF
jgi:hypothetical protein